MIPVMTNVKRKFFVINYLVLKFPMGLNHIRVIGSLTNLVSGISRTLGLHCCRSIPIGRELRVIVGKGLIRLRIGSGVGEWSGHRRKGFGSALGKSEKK